MHLKMKRAGAATFCLAALGLVLTGCGGGSSNNDDPFEGPTVYVVTEDNRLVSFNTASPSVLRSTANITGLSGAAGEKFASIDFRPANGRLYGITTATNGTKRLYELNTSTGAVTFIANINGLTGDEISVDFNPVVDRLRVVSDTGDNLRVDVSTGATTVDTDLDFAAGDVNQASDASIGGVAYLNNTAGATTTTLYGIDFNRNALVTVGSVGGTPASPNSGQLFTIRNFSVDLGNRLSFDIMGTTNQALFVSQISGATPFSLFSVDLTNGNLTLVGTLPITNSPIRGLAISP